MKKLAVLRNILIVAVVIAAVAFAWELTRPWHSPDNAVDQVLDQVVSRELPAEDAAEDETLLLSVSEDELEATLAELGIDPDEAMTVTQERVEYKPEIDFEDEAEGEEVLEPEELSESDYSDEVVRKALALGRNEENLVLFIPKLGMARSIADGTTKAVLDQGPGLFDSSDLPGEGDLNVAIAGHRDNYGSHFYYIDQIGSGDHLYLIHRGKIYTYEYREAYDVIPTDWSPVFRQGYSCLTLVTCTPIGVASHRLIVHAELVSVDDYSKDFEFEW